MKKRITWSNRHRDYATIYISKEEFNKELIKSSEAGKWTERAGELIITLVENIAMSKYFKLNSFEFIISEAMMDYVILAILEKNLHDYEVGKGDGFSLFSKIVFNRCSEFLRSRVGKNSWKDIYGENTKCYCGKNLIKATVINIDDLYSQI
jgi:hypothetical protein